ncbi:hypothetical protein PROCOU_02749 [Listeria rocourtiae FSL F6-920]|nr:hypothetical protein PROCOU_02749 [Listeria rocourtiae FSL F6-920]
MHKKIKNIIYIYVPILFVGIMIASRLEPWIGEKVVTIIQFILFCICAPIIIWMRWQNRRMDKQNEVS